jgi:hypothetical protein
MNAVHSKWRINVGFLQVNQWLMWLAEAESEEEEEEDGDN